MASLCESGVGMTPLLYQYEPHAHAFWECVYYLEGEGTLTVGPRKIRFAPGTLVFVPPHTLHQEHAANGYRNYHAGMRDVSLGERDIVFTDNNAGDIRALLDMLYRAAHAQEGRNAALSASLLEALFNTLWTSSAMDDKLVERMIHSIIHNISNPSYRIGQAYEGIPMSRDHLRRRFIVQTGRTPTGYLLAQRMRQAENLLSASGYPSIKQVACLCGFLDPYYFSRAFKKHSGVPPNRYRAQARSKTRTSEKDEAEYDLD